MRRVVLEFDDGTVVACKFIRMTEDPRYMDRLILDVEVDRESLRPDNYFKRAEAMLDERDAKMQELGQLLAITTAGDVDAKRLAFGMLRKVRNGEMTVDQALRVAKISFAAYGEELMESGDTEMGLTSMVEDAPKPTDVKKRFEALELEED